MTAKAKALWLLGVLVGAVGVEVWALVFGASCSGDCAVGAPSLSPSVEPLRVSPPNGASINYRKGVP
jgi:hypothetical protein